MSIAVHKPDNKDGGAIEKVGVMRVISRKILREFSEEHSDAREALYAWYRVASKAIWQNLLDVQQIYPKAEARQWETSQCSILRETDIG